MTRPPRRRLCRPEERDPPGAQIYHVCPGVECCGDQDGEPVRADPGEDVDELGLAGELVDGTAGIPYPAVPAAVRRVRGALRRGIPLDGRCHECDGPLVWAGTSWHPHGSRDHAGLRRTLDRAVLRVLVELAAGRRGP
ncbi:hypothetical protein [Kitasatospora sp. NPDC088346]|uniref:hypothetical protein n=1 Tax=Kitasatospora sp. NPDC088346 TaxID=3364073 RepID=UPI00381424AA